MKYETEFNKENERRIAKIYCEINPQFEVKELAEFSSYDYARYDVYGGGINGFLEIKKRKGLFPKWEYFTYSKADFTRESRYDCFFIVERDYKAVIYNMTNLIRLFDNESKRVFKSEIVRKDRPEDAQTWDVLKFPADMGTDLYYI